MRDWKSMEGRSYKWEEVFGTRELEPQKKGPAVIIYGQGKGFRYQFVVGVFGVLKNKWERENKMEYFPRGSNFDMHRHIILLKESTGQGTGNLFYSDESSLKGYYAPAGFEIFAEFNSKTFKEALKMLGYDEEVVGQAEMLKQVFPSSMVKEYFLPFPIGATPPSRR